MIDYTAFVDGLRMPLEGARLSVVKEAFAKINSEPGAECFTVAQAKTAFSYDEFDKWCEAIGCKCVDGEIVSWTQFCNFYEDISMTIFNDKEFVSLVSDSWTVADASRFFIHPKDVETLVAAIRHNLMKFGSSRNSEEYVLRNIFREFDIDNSGALSLNELKCILNKINLACDDRYL